MDEGEEGTGEFIVAGGDSPKVFELVEKPFDEVPFFVESSVIVSLNFARYSRWNDGLSARIEDVVGVVALVGYENING